ncbi:MAG TPA: tail fiber protein [Pyrinomonadaceae bacterium]|nr:tail fiber protein [Pyrinomonadaceae bacterium]
MPEPYVGEIRMFAGNFAPAGWMLCQGQQLPISENDVLFTLLGTTYGGDGESTFNLPNLASRVPVHMGNGPDGVTYQIGEAAGTESVTLTTQQIPIHTHAMLASNDIPTLNSPGSNVVGQAAAKFFRSGAPNAQMNNASLQAVGGSQPHENCQPFLCINFIISLFGRFPSQT